MAYVSKVKVGTRYCWSPYVRGTDKFLNGICESINEEEGYAILVCRDGSVWRVGFDGLVRYKDYLKKEKGKK